MRTSYPSFEAIQFVRFGGTLGWRELMAQTTADWTLYRQQVFGYSSTSGVGSDPRRSGGALVDEVLRGAAGALVRGRISA